MPQQENVSLTSYEEGGDSYKNIPPGCFRVGFCNAGTIPNNSDRLQPKNIKLKRSIDKFKLNIPLLNEANQYWGKISHSNRLSARVSKWYSCTKVVTGYNKNERPKKDTNGVELQ